MDNEFYYEESNPKKAKLIFLFLIIICIVIGCLFVIVRKKYTFNLKKEIVYEVGSEINKDVSYYLNNKVFDVNDYNLILTSIPMEDNILTNTGKYNYVVTFNNISKKGIIKVIDTTSPVVEVVDLKIGVGEEFSPDEFISICEDYSKPCNVKLKNEEDGKNNKKEGEYTFDIIISDKENNKVTKTVNLKVVEGYSNLKNKENDLNPSYIDPEFSDWDGKMIIKLDKGIDPEKIEETDAYSNLMEILEGDFHSYIDSMYENNRIDDSQIIEVFNKSGLIIGYAIRIKLDNGLVFYLSK